MVWLRRHPRRSPPPVRRIVQVFRETVRLRYDPSRKGKGRPRTRFRLLTWNPSPPSLLSPRRNSEHLHQSVTSHRPSTKQPGTVNTAQPSWRESNNQHCIEPGGPQRIISVQPSLRHMVRVPNSLSRLGCPRDDLLALRIGTAVRGGRSPRVDPARSANLPDAGTLLGVDEWGRWRHDRM
jgi:hypothetical protein